MLLLVPLAVSLGSGMNVVGGRIAVNDLDGLIGDYAHHMRMVFAAALIERNGFFGNVERAVAQAFFDIDEDVGEVSAAGHHVFRHVGALAGGVLAHVNLGGLWGFAFKFHGAGDAGGRGGINRSGRGRSAGSSGGLVSFLFAAPREEDKAERSGQAPNCYRSFLSHVFAVPLLKFECSNQMKIYSGAPRPALPEGFALDDELPDAALERPMAAPTLRCSSGVSCRM